MATYTNFYERITEARRRLEQTIILYDGYPCKVLGIYDHRPDGIYRLYLDPLPDTEKGLLVSQRYELPYTEDEEDPEGVGHLFDEFMSDVSSKLMRKKINSPKFNKFRPFELGMMNYRGQTLYTQRRPLRRSPQGLVPEMIHNEIVNFGRAVKRGADYYAADFWTKKPFRDTILGVYPDKNEALLVAIKDGSCAISRDFAVMYGPASLFFVVYRDNFIGTLPEGDFSALRLAKEYEYAKEVAVESGLFERVV